MTFRTYRYPGISLVAVIACMFASILPARAQGVVTAAPAEAPYLAQVGAGAERLRSQFERQAADEFAGANRQDYVDPLAWIGLGAAGLARGHVDAALADFDRAAQVAASGSPQAQRAAALAAFGRAICLLHRGQAAAARSRLSELTAGGAAWALPLLAYADLAVGDRPAAGAHAEAALAAFPRDALALSVAGRVSPGPAGIARLREALQACPGSPYAAPTSALAIPGGIQRRAVAEPIHVEIKPEAGGSTARVTWRGEGAPDYLLLRLDGSVMGMSNTPPHLFSLRRNLEPGMHAIVAEAWMNGRIEAHGGAIITAPGTPTVADRYPDADYAAAMDVLRAALMPAPNRVHLHYWLAGAYAAAGNARAALTNYERVVALDPAFADARKRTAELCKLLGLAGPTQVAEEGRRPQVYITFDDGPNPMLTGDLLDVLREYGVRATFFVVGAQARAHPELLKAIAAAGHDIANHSYSHDDMTTKSAAEFEQELLLTQAIVEDATGKRPRLFRPPGGRHNATVRAAAARLGYETVLWTANISVAAGLPPEDGVERLLREVRPGAIVLLHNGPDETYDLLPGLLKALKGKGYSFGVLTPATAVAAPKVEVKRTPVRQAMH